MKKDDIKTFTEISAHLERAVELLRMPDDSWHKVTFSMLVKKQEHGTLIDSIMVHVDGGLKLQTKKWYQFWK